VAEWERVARRFTDAAFHLLGGQHVIPPPVFHPEVKVGRDYFGPDLHDLADYQAFERALEADYPQRFSEPLQRRNAEFASMYIFSFLEACVAYCSVFQGAFDARSQSVDRAIEELATVLSSDNTELVCCRAVSHLSTESAEPLTVGPVTVIPAPPGRDAIPRLIAAAIPAAFSAFNREPPFFHDPPHALLVARETVGSEDGIDDARGRLNAEIERFLLAVRLLHAGTTISHYQMTGSAQRISHYGPSLIQFPNRFPTSLIRRVPRLGNADVDAIPALMAMIDSADVKRTKMAAASFDVAVSKFHASHHEADAFERLVDLATALEATLLSSESDTTEVTYRLRYRAAALLSSDNDPPAALFADVGALYGLRSRLVHGGDLKQTQLEKTITGLSGVGSSEGFGVAVERGVDRLRDVVRRAILARLCLASPPDVLWPLAGASAVDSALADPNTAKSWREAWKARLAQIGAGFAADKCHAALEFLSREGREHGGSVRSRRLDIESPPPGKSSASE
jgi:hypothetical protein